MKLRLVAFVSLHPGFIGSDVTDAIPEKKNEGCSVPMRQWSSERKKWQKLRLS